MEVAGAAIPLGRPEGKVTVEKPLNAGVFIPQPLVPLLFTNHLRQEETVALSAAFLQPDCLPPTNFSKAIQRTDGRAREVLGIRIGEGNYADEVRIVADLQKPLAIVHGKEDQLISLPDRFNRLLTEFIETI